MELLACPCWASGDENCPRERNQDGDEDNWVRPVDVVGGLEGRCLVRGAGDPFAVETEGDIEGHHDCKVEDQNRGTETKSEAASVRGDVFRGSHFSC